MAPTPRPLGDSGIEVSPLALGSWQTFERIPREVGVAVMREARARGISFFDVARYDDRTGTAPLRTGYSEVVFGEVFRAAGVVREEVVVADKLWWEFWPEQTAAEELAASLQRTGFEGFDLVYSDPPPAGLESAAVVEEIGGLLASGKARAWGVVNWPADRLADVIRSAVDRGLPPPCAVQLPYSVVQRAWVEGGEMVAALEAAGAGVVASYALAGGALTGKYPAPSGRLAERLEEPETQRAIRAAERLRALADETGATLAALAIAWALTGPRVASVLFGATTPQQVTENAQALEMLDALSGAQLAELRRVGE